MTRPILAAILSALVVLSFVGRISASWPAQAIPSASFVAVHGETDLGRTTRAPRKATGALAPESGDSTMPAPGHLIKGVASWFCSDRSPCTRSHPPSCLCAAAGPALRVGDWRGRVVTVTANGRSVEVRLVDWCACRGRVIDLYASVFSRLTPLSRGLVRVRVAW